MGWFDKKKSKPEPEKIGLPPLPKLPELPKLKEFYGTLPKLPALPKSSLGETRGDEVFDEEEFEEDKEVQIGQKPLAKFYEKITPKKGLGAIQETPRKIEFQKETKKQDSVFVRLDKFEESLKLFEKTKTKIEEVEHALQNTKKIKEEETKELEAWEKEINLIKEQLEEIDKNIFSKIE